MDVDKLYHLDELAPGKQACVIDVLGDDHVSSRLVELGFWPGTLIEAIRRAPLGDPTEYYLRGYRLALRRNEAHRVRVSIPGRDVL
ncbi:MAG: ferrous iron transport protein A [Myxococcales bacterium]|nr:ferrous iron transport protein A [Myxococcales bacterium]